MEIVRARSAGFCFGVNHALTMLDRELGLVPESNASLGGEAPGMEGPSSSKSVCGSRLVTLGPIIHNPLVMEHYSALGVVCSENLPDIHAGDRVLIRAHGIPCEMERALEATGAVVIDATCPKVKQAQLSIQAKTADGKTLLLFGEKEHPEVRGLVSYAGGMAHVFSSLHEIAESLIGKAGDSQTRREGEFVLAAQTTQDKELFEKAREWLFSVLVTPPVVLNTICDATRRRQQEAMHIAEKVEAMVVVGGRNSGNTRRLADVARAQGIPAFLAEQVSDLEPAVLKGFARIGLTAGASTPASHIEAVQEFLARL